MSYYEPPVPEDAVPIWDVIGGGDEPLVGSWYMPAPTAGRAHVGPWQRRTIVFLVGVFLIIEVLGLCSAYGVVQIG